MSSLVSIKGLNFKYPKSESFALKDLSLEIEEGSFFALLGPNGAGKTTLMRLLCGRLPHYTGTLKIASAYQNGKGFLDSNKFGVLLENPGVYPRLTVAEYLSYFAGFYGIERGEAVLRGREVLKKISGPSLDIKLSQLSLGNKQKLQIARALVHRPKILILDEPVANLDPESREQVWNYIGDWRKELGGTAIVCSHILAEMETEATDYAIIDKGVVLRSGNLQDEFQKQEGKTARFEIEVQSQIDEGALRAALLSAGIPVGQLKKRGMSLSDIYREAISH